jgi:metal-responsive CopG/Arc/MetJ family transcriptional regulator
MTMHDVAMRTVIDLSPDQVSALDAISRRERISRAEAVRRAVAQYVQARAEEAAGDAFGLWADRNVDGLEYEQRLREEWTA